jgi:hypothetical protein
MEAHLRAGYEGQLFMKYKETISGNFDDSACSQAFADYFNYLKTTNYTSIQVDSIYRTACNKPLTLFIIETNRTIQYLMVEN